MGGREDSNLEEGKERSLGDREKTSLERGMEVHESTSMERDESQGMEKSVETSVGKSLGTSSSWLGLRCLHIQQSQHTHTELYVCLSV